MELRAEWLILAVAVVLLVGWAVSLELRAHARRLRSEFGASVQKVNDDLEALDTLAGRCALVERELGALREQLALVRERQGQLELHGAAGHRYEQAIELVSQGFDIPQLMSCCGLSRGEAELVAQLHGPERAGRAGG